ncbi:hypothetical protein L873DRAFT_628596 [Choiromyces venosus 120613-1]|uniref:DDE-1 domain-containing protein n=1 Tax=Choiromyces venosus 120613-1 TaxID=1336337 RepID=A0A3N4JTK8_9PEZI|nr:hypothetical protein L873DRAFT_628596 [Choiromyces venosus 120613-1]
MDLADFHITDSILAIPHENNIVPLIIPGGCSGLLQPLDTTVNSKPFKEYLREETETYHDEHATIEDIGRWTISEKRIMTPHVVSCTWKAFCQQKQSLIVKAFRDVGVMLPIDGSQDGDIKIKGFTTSEIDIGN